jgi:hypothetical protein
MTTIHDYQVAFSIESRAPKSLGCHTGNHLAAVATVNSEILVGREDDGIGKRFGHANEASIGEAHGNVGILLDQLDDWPYVLGKRKGNQQSAAVK